MNEIFGEKYAFFQRSDVDQKGRVFGFIVELQENLTTGECIARVQRGIQTKDSFKKFGASQPKKVFKNKEEAKRWAYSTAKQRAASR